MKIKQKTKAQLLAELTKMRLRVAELEAQTNNRSLPQKNTLWPREYRYRNLLERTTNGILIIRGLRFIACNPIALNLVNCSKDQVVGHSLEDLSPPLQPDGASSRVKMLDILKKAYSGHPVVLEWALTTGDGQPVDIELSLSRADNGTIPTLLCMWQDISKRKRAENELRCRNRELALLNRVISASTSAVEQNEILKTMCRELALAFDVPQAATILVDVAAASATIVAEYRTGEISSSLNNHDSSMSIEDDSIFQHLLTCKTPLTINDVQNDARFTPGHGIVRLKDTTSLLIIPLIIEEKAAGWLVLEAAQQRNFSSEEVTPAWNVAKQMSGVLAQFRLYEQHQRLKEQYHQAQKMEAIGQLAGGIAHDFNNILTTITGFAELVLDDLPPDSPSYEMIDKVSGSSQRAADLIRQLLVFSRKETIEPRILKLNSMVTRTKKMLARLIETNIEMQTILLPDLWPVNADPAQMEQIILNIVVNARDAMPEGGNLVIETSNVVLDEGYVAGHLEAQPGHYVLLTISDSGCGMSKETQAHIFEPFFTTKKAEQGTGLGLATVFGIVKQNGGTVWVYSEEGMGTTFKIYLPASLKSKQPSKPKNVRSTSLNGTETILVVEDDAAVREMVEKALTRRGYALLAAKNGQEALQAVKHHSKRIDLLLTDVVMPGLPGKVLATELVESRPEMKILYMSGYSNGTLARQGIPGDRGTFIQKPFSPTALAKTVRTVLDAG